MMHSNMLKMNLNLPSIQQLPKRQQEANNQHPSPANTIVRLDACAHCSAELFLVIFYIFFREQLLPFNKCGVEVEFNNY